METTGFHLNLFLKNFCTPLKNKYLLEIDGDDWLSLKFSPNLKKKLKFLSFNSPHYSLKEFYENYLATLHLFFSQNVCPKYNKL